MTRTQHQRRSRYPERRPWLVPDPPKSLPRPWVVWTPPRPWRSHPRHAPAAWPIAPAAPAPVAVAVAVAVVVAVAVEPPDQALDSRQRGYLRALAADPMLTPATAIIVG
jgi:hypothetical protein